MPNIELPLKTKGDMAMVVKATDVPIIDGKRVQQFQKALDFIDEVLDSSQEGCVVVHNEPEDARQDPYSVISGRELIKGWMIPEIRRLYIEEGGWKEIEISSYHSDNSPTDLRFYRFGTETSEERNKRLEDEKHERILSEEASFDIFLRKIRKWLFIIILMIFVSVAGIITSFF